MRYLFLPLCIALLGANASAFAQERAVPDSPADMQLSFAPIVKKTAPAVVNVFTKKMVTQSFSPFAGDPFFEQFFGRSFGGMQRQGIENSLGSGVIVDDKGTVVTNAHVVKGAQEISVVLNDGREFDATLALSDPQSDLAVLHLDSEGQNLPYANLKPSENLQVGDIVLAIGNPFGVGQTVTSGIVSALSRSTLNINDFNFFIQTDAAINPGNSGGPLVAMDGGVVGINTAIYSRDGGSLGIGFAVPSEMVATVVAAAAQEPGEDGQIRITRAWMGFDGQTVTADIADSLGLSRPQGVLISKIHPASPAKKAGLIISDVITHINDREIRDSAELKFRLATIPIGTDARFDVLRKGKKLELSIPAIAPPEEPPRNETLLEGEHPMRGIKVAQINPALAIEMGKDVSAEGVVVLEAGRGLVRPGDIVVAVNEEEITTIKDLQNTLKKGQGARGWSFTIDRNGTQNRIIIR